ncbi:MAG: photosystem II reaction center PsbP family protein [Chroococcus sp. CMT-3BRIN-NPC107]|nr:photosystem II reaction center PsbP family protein [Chroococcus sp. CMT-3BRIN-NPC107]
MLKKIAAFLLVIAVTFNLASCATAGAGLKSYVDAIGGYEFLYPNGWLPVKVSNGADIVFHDLIEVSENVSVVVSPVADGKTLAELGTPSEVGYKLSKSPIAPPDSGREAELVNAAQREVKGKKYYLLEYAVKSNQQERHNLASVAVSRGKLYTFNASAPEKRWKKVQKQFESVVDSFLVY